MQAKKLHIATANELFAKILIISYYQTEYFGQLVVMIMDNCQRAHLGERHSLGWICQGEWKRSLSAVNTAWLWPPTARWASLRPLYSKTAVKWTFILTPSGRTLSRIVTSTSTVAPLWNNVKVKFLTISGKETIIFTNKILATFKSNAIYVYYEEH